MLKIKLFLLFIFICTPTFSQSLFKDFYLSAENSYRSYGRNDHIGFGGGMEYSKNLKKWFGIGMNISYWQDRKKDWDFTNPFTGENYKYYGVIKDYKVSIFTQLFPYNSNHFSPYIQIGGYSGYFYQEYYLGGYATSYNPDEFIVFIYDDGYKGISYGFEMGIGLRFQFDNFIIVPSITKTNNSILFDKDGYDGLNLKLGWNFK